MSYKILFLTDSNANPRSFPIAETTELEETYPYLIRNYFGDSIFYQLSFGNITTEELLSQAIAYLAHWKPDIIIVHSGISDCRPEAFTELQKDIINVLPDPVYRYLSRYMYHPHLIKVRQISRVSKRRFRKTLKKFKLVFNKSKIFWLEISVAPGYENIRPGVSKLMREYNDIIEEIYNGDMVKVHELLLEVKGHNSDNLHLNKFGHEHIYEILLERIKHHLIELDRDVSVAG